MNGYYRNNILKSFKDIVNEPIESKYAKRVIGSVNRHLQRKRYAHFSEVEPACIVEESNRSALINKSSENYEEVIDQDSDEASTIDSGVLTLRDETPKKSQKKKLSFSPQKEVIEIDVEKYHPKYYDLPEKCIVRITDTPRPQKAVYRTIHTSTPKEPKEEITTEVLQQANLIRNHHCNPEIMLDLTSEDRNLARLPSTRSMDDKFVVNLYESRPSKRWKRRGICIPEGALQSLINSPEMVQQSEETSCKTIYSEPWSEEEELDDNAMLQKLEKEKDAECIRMKQASNVLQIIRKSHQAEWSEELLAEKILLETEEKYALLVNKIRDLGYTQVVSPKPSHVATATLTNFEFILEPQESKQSKFSNFYVIILSHGTELQMSKVTSPDENKLIFEEQFTFGNLNSDFTITVKMFTVQLKTCGKSIFSSLRKRTRKLCPMSKIHYESVNTCETEASSVLKTAFSCCGEFQLTKGDIDSTHLALSKIPADSHLLPEVTFALKIDDLRIYSKASGFLTLSLPDKQNDVLFWERKWCVLNGIRFFIYNYPSEEDSGKPILSIDLEYCLTPISKNCEGCPKQRNFLLKTGKPAAFDDKMNAVFRRKSNFVVQKYFFASDNSADFEMWTSKLQSILDCLQNWRKLIFFDDYY